jgi:anti-anti-sigma factor
MNVKIDTKEKFTVITPNEAEISANMTGELSELMLNQINKDVPHIILNMQNVNQISNEAVEKIALMQQEFYEKNCSFVLCSLNDNILAQLDESQLLESMNITPTESEAWDIVQMEEIERELMAGFDNNDTE